ncbi:MAG: phosphate ABC transporter permease PstA [Desulfotalea sp.]
MKSQNNKITNSPLLKKRYRKEKIFERLGILAITISISFVIFLFTNVVYSGYKAFLQTSLILTIDLEQSEFRKENLSQANYPAIIKKSLREMFPDIQGRKAKKDLYAIVSPGASYIIQDYVVGNPGAIGSKIQIQVPANDDVDMFVKGNINKDLPENERRINNKQLEILEVLKEDGRLVTNFNTTFFTAGDSREPELAGIWGAACGSLYTLLITLCISFPIAVASAVYLEEFAPANKWTDLIEVNINNLAAVPSIIFGLLGLAIFINIWGVPRSTPLIGGVVLSLMTLPTIIIASRASLKSVPPSIREAALGVGASKMQTITHHVLPLALPGILTGTIIGMAQALGETAPLLMIGMIAFIVDIPGGFTDPATVLPVQIYLWADSPERAFSEKTSAAIMVLLFFLISMNAVAVFLRKKFETKW